MHDLARSKSYSFVRVLQQQSTALMTQLKQPLEWLFQFQHIDPPLPSIHTHAVMMVECFKQLPCPLRLEYKS